MTRLILDRANVAIGDAAILHDISFEAEGGALIGLVGPNGAGKSTLARTIAALIPAQGGSVMLDGQPLATMDRRQAARNLSYLAQSDTIHWPLAVRATVALGRAPHLGRFSALSAADHQAVARAMERTDVAGMADRDVKRLSGGERSRVLLARALAVEAPILIADEPVGSLDPRHALRIMALLREEAQRGALVIVVLHDLALASRFCDRLLLMREGRLVADGVPHEVLSADGMERHYAVTGHHGAHETERFVIPWKALP